VSKREIEAIARNQHVRMNRKDEDGESTASSLERIAANSL